MRKPSIYKNEMTARHSAYIALSTFTAPEKLIVRHDRDACRFCVCVNPELVLDTRKGIDLFEFPYAPESSAKGRKK